MQTVVMRSITRVARTYLGMNQTQFAKAVNLTQPDLSELEQKTEPFGAIAKYRRISDYLGIPVDTLLRNDFTAIPESFFEKFPPHPYTAAWNSSNHDLGRAGEEFIFRWEQERLADLYPNFAKLVLPFFKLDIPSPGFDILTFDDLGVPYALKVKTTAASGSAFQLTTNEYAATNAYTKAGERYVVAYISNFGKESQSVKEIPFAELRRDFKIQPMSYRCLRLPEPQPITGLAYFRRLRGLPQQELAQHLGMPACNLSLVETGQRPLSAVNYLSVAKILGTTVDALLQTYNALPEVAHES